MRRNSLAAAAVISAAALMLPAAPALAAGHGHGHANGHQHTATTHGHAQNSHADHQLRGAEHAVANQLRQLTGMTDRVAALNNVGDADLTALTGALQADVDALTALQSQLASATSHHDVVTALHQGILIRAVARTQTTVAEQADAVLAAAAGTTTTDPTTGTTTTADTVSTDAEAAIAAVVALDPDSSRAQIHQARQTAEAALSDAEAALGTSTEPTDGGDSDPSSGTSTPTP